MNDKRNTAIKNRIYSMRDSLLDKNYTVREIAELFGVTAKYIRDDMISLSGAPSVQEKTSKRIIISGLAFKRWIEEHYKPSQKKDLIGSCLHKGNNVSQSRRIKQMIYQKRNKLLNMEYTISDLSYDLGIDDDYIRYKMIQRQGAPAHIDSKKHLCVYGLELKSWIEENYSPEKLRPKTVPLSENEYYCVKCRKRRETELFTVLFEENYSCKRATCPVCGSQMNKYIKRS